jgi:hypothetical protein
VWDARVVSFGNELTTEPPLIARRDSISVRVPAHASGIVNVTLLTRAGASIGSFDDTWVLVAPSVPSPSGGPKVWGVVPASGPPGTTAKILGAKLLSPTSITFGGVPADLSGLPPFPKGFGEQVEVPVPSGPTGTVPVTVTTAQGTSPAFPPFSEFTYTHDDAAAPPPATAYR